MKSTEIIQKQRRLKLKNDNIDAEDCLTFQQDMQRNPSSISFYLPQIFLLCHNLKTNTKWICIIQLIIINHTIPPWNNCNVLFWFSKADMFSISETKQSDESLLIFWSRWKCLLLQWVKGWIQNWTVSYLFYDWMCISTQKSSSLTVWESIHASISFCSLIFKLSQWPGTIPKLSPSWRWCSGFQKQRSSGIKPL